MLDLADAMEDVVERKAERKWRAKQSLRICETRLEDTKRRRE